MSYGQRSVQHPVSYYNRGGDVQKKMSAIESSLNYPMYWIETLSDSQIYAIYKKRVIKNSEGTADLQMMVRAAIERDELEVRRRAGLV